MNATTQLSGAWKTLYRKISFSLLLSHSPPTQNDKTQKWMRRGHAHPGLCPFQSFGRTWEISLWSRRGCAFAAFSFFCFLWLKIKSLRVKQVTFKSQIIEIVAQKGPEGSVFPVNDLFYFISAFDCCICLGWTCVYLLALLFYPPAHPL